VEPKRFIAVPVLNPEAALLVTQKVVISFVIFLFLVSNSTLDPDPKPDPEMETECIAVTVPIRRKVAAPEVPVPQHW
jgi:hypothetical protein